MLKKLLEQFHPAKPHTSRDAAARLFDRADAAFRSGDLAAAAAAYEAALRADPSNALAQYYLGLCLVRLNCLDAAIAAFTRSLELEPSRHKASLGIAEAALLIGDAALAATHYRRALDIAPDHAGAWFRLAKLEYGAGRAWEAAQAYERAWRLEPTHRVAASNYLYCCAFSSEVSAGQLLLRCEEWARHAVAARIPDADLLSPRGQQSRIRIAFLSPDFRDHPMQFFFMPLLRAHDRKRFKLYCLNDAKEPDDVQARMRQVSSSHGDDTWIDCAPWDDVTLAQFIATEAIDVLVDLAGHTRGNRLAMMALRRAPVQMTALGYPGTTGCSAIDIKVTDDIADPPGADAFYSERLSRHSRGFWCFEPPADAPAIAPAPAHGARAFTFGYFGEPCKISNEVLQAWSSLLQRAPNARLILKLAFARRAGARAAMSDRLRAAGIPQECVELQGPTVPLADFLQCYAQVDVVLDTWPFNGGTTTCLALWMGVPVLTMAGESLRSRMGASILSRLGMQEWVTHTPSEYVAYALRVAASPVLAHRLRHSLRGRMGVLTDARAWVAEFEDVCEQALAKARAGTRSFDSRDHFP